MLDSEIKLSKLVVVGPQPDEEKLKALAKRGFKTVINLSGKGELGQAFSPEDEGKAVTDLGIEYQHHPVALNRLKPDQIDAFCELLEEAPKPAYVHCRIGQRSVPLSLIFHALRRKLSPKQALDRAKKLGISWSAPFLKTTVTTYLEKQAQAA